MDFCGAGHPSQIDGETFIVTKRGEAGFAVFGPYSRFEPGKYYVTFNVLAEEAPATGDDLLVGAVDVAASEGRIILARANVYARRSIAARGELIMPFELIEPQDLEFRVRATGHAPLRVKFERPVQSNASGVADYAPMKLMNLGSPSHFLLRHFHHISHLYDNGIDIEVDDNYALVRRQGLTLKISEGEEFQVFNEVFIGNDYTFRSRRKRVVLDVGMNAGFASILLAADPNTVRVYSFEPFTTPYNRALRNFELNQAVSAKIKPLHIGLSDKTYKAAVKVDARSTIGVSLEGAADGPEEIIAIEDASDALTPIVEDALANDLEVAMKIDCEGSEFAIIDTLSKSGLLQHIDILMIEWHKWWKADKTQEDLIRPLNLADFVVFDKTNPGDQYAGMLYAVNAGKSAGATKTNSKESL